MKPWVNNAVIFVVGLLMGCAGTGFYIHHCFSRAWVNSGNHQHAVAVLDKELVLSTAERTEIEKIFDDAAPAMETLRAETNTKLKVVRDDTSTQIRLVLNDDQKKQFEQDHQSMQERTQQRPQGDGPGGGGPPPQQ